MMTRENAILHMVIRREELKRSVGDLDEDIKAFDMAIKALERERQFLEAGYKNERVEFYIGGRKFMVKELAQ